MADQSSPITVAAPGIFTQVTAGLNSGYGLREDGRVFAWGDNSQGQLGDNSITQRNTPVLVIGFHVFDYIAAGWNHLLAIREDGSLWAWGRGTEGQLGTGTAPVTESSPVSVLGGHEFIKVDAGECHSVGLKADGTIWAWGCNDDGQLGDNTTTSKSSPVSISTTILFSDIAAGDNHNLAIDENGYIWAWGSNTSGQLGDGTTTNKSSPVSVLELSNMIDIAAGTQYSYALDENEEVWAWGNNTCGKLGDGTTTAKSSPVLIKHYELTKLDELNESGMGWIINIHPSPDYSYIFVHSRMYANSNDGATFYSIDVSDPTNMSIADSYGVDTNDRYDLVYQGLGGLNGLNKWVGWIEVSFTPQILIYDWTSKTVLPDSYPFHDYQFAFPSSTYREPRQMLLHPNENYMYVIMAIGNSVECFDVSDPTSITHAGRTVDATYINQASGLAMNSISHVYTWARSTIDGSGRFTVWDVGANPWQLTYSGHIDVSGTLTGGNILACPLSFNSGNYVYVACQGSGGNDRFLVIDVSNKSAPTVVSNINVGNILGSVPQRPIQTSNGEILFIPTYDSAQGVKIYDMLDPTNPQLIRNVNVGATSNGCAAIAYDETNGVLYTGTETGSGESLQSWRFRRVF